MNSNEELDKMSYDVIKGDVAYQDCTYKLVIIGDTGVGKSCLLLRGTKDEFRNEHEVTIGVEFGSFFVKLEGKTIKIQIWDTAGQEAFQSVTKVFYKGSHCIFLVYDMTREASFIKLQTWLREIKDTASASTMLVLVGNMLDLEEKRAITRERALDFKSQESLDAFIETSAKSGENVQDLFVRTAKMLHLQHSGKTTPKPTPVRVLQNIITPPKAKKRCTC